MSIKKKFFWREKKIFLKYLFDEEVDMLQFQVGMIVHQQDD